MKKWALNLLFAGLLITATAGVSLADDREMDEANSATAGISTYALFDGDAASEEDGE